MKSDSLKLIGILLTLLIIIFMEKELKIEELTKSDITEDLFFKIVVVGDCAVGKSNILSRYINNQFSKESKSTIGVELSSKCFKIDNKVIKINIWDTAGQERFTSITSAYYKGAKGALIVYDITRQDTFDNIDKWLRELRLKINADIKVFIIGNKSDLSLLRQVDYEEAKRKAEKLKVKLYETSALDSKNINEAFKTLIIDIYRSSLECNNNDITGGFSLKKKQNEEEDDTLKCSC